MTDNNNNEVFDPLAWASLNDNNSAAQPQNLTSSMAVLPVRLSLLQGDDIETQVRDLSAFIVDQGIDITSGYDNWYKLGFALANGMGENGRSIYHDLSRMNSGYNAEECDKQYTACLHGKGSGITIKTFFQMVKEAGVDLSQFAKEHLPAHDVSATSANPPSANNSKKVEKSTILGILDSEMAVGGMAEVAETASSGDGYTFSDKLKIEDLDDISRTIFNLHGGNPVLCDSQLLGVYNEVSGIMGAANGTPEERGGIYGVYDGRIVYAPLYNIDFGGAGSDKGNLIFCKYLVNPIKNEMRRKYEAEKSEYEVALAEWEAKGKKDRGPAPKEPLYRDPYVPGNSSSSAVYRAIDANGGWGMMFETEADTISSMIDSDYGNYSDLMRKAYHHETLSMNRVTEKIHIDIDEPRLSIFLTCTPGQLPALFPSFENGLGSRFFFHYKPEVAVEFHDVFALQDTPLEDKYKKLGEDLLPLYHAMQMRAGHPIQFVMSQSQQCEFVETYSGILKEQFTMLGYGFSAFVYRMALGCFRYAMILSALRRLSEWKKKFNPSDPDQPSIFRDEENALVCDNRDFRTAMTIMGCLINHTARVYAILAKEDDNPFAQKGIKLTADETKVFNALQEGNFCTADFIKIAASFNIPERTAQRMLSQFCRVYCIVNPVHRGVYNKPARKETDV